MVACAENHTKIVKELLERKADTNITDQQVHLHSLLVQQSMYSISNVLGMGLSSCMGPMPLSRNCWSTVTPLLQAVALFAAAAPWGLCSPHIETCIRAWLASSLVLALKGAYTSCRLYLPGLQRLPAFQQLPNARQSSEPCWLTS